MLQISNTHPSKPFNPEDYGEEFVAIFGKGSSKSNGPPISTFNWKSTPKGKKHKYEGSCFIDDEEYQRILELLKEAELESYPELVFPAVALTFYSRRNFKYKKRDFDKQLKLLKKLKRKDISIDGINIKMSSDGVSENLSIIEQDFTSAMRSSMIYYLNLQRAAIAKAAEDQKKKGPHTYFKRNRNMVLSDTFDSLSHLEVMDNEKYIILGKLLVAVGLIDGREAYERLLSEGKQKSTYKSYNDYLKDRSRAYIKKHEKSSG